MSHVSFGELQLTKMLLNFKASCCNLKIRKNYDVLKWKSPCILFNRNVDFNKNETESKMENPTHSLRETNLVLQSIYESKFKVKLWCVGQWERRKRVYFALFILSEGIFFLTLCFIPMYSKYTFRICILLHIKKNYLMHFCCLLLKLWKAYIFLILIYTIFARNG